jgi:hypothetical protein
MTRRRPQAKTYVALLSSMAPGEARGPWTRLHLVSELLPGDIIAWRKSPLQKSKNTGHVMIVEGPPRQRDPSEWVVPIIDSSGGHRGADPRHHPDATGLGRGTVVLVGETGEPRAFRWSELPESPVLDTSIMLGRLR